MRTVIIFLLIFVLFSLPVLADELKITDIDAVVNGDLINNIDENHIDLEVRSGDEVALMIELENQHRPSTSIDIEILDLFVSVNGNNLVSESMNFDIDAGEEVTRKVTFTVPDLNKSAYALKIEVEGIDDDNHIQEDVEFIDLILKKDKNLFVEKIEQPKTQTKTSASDVSVIFAGNKYQNLKNKESRFSYLSVSLIAFVIFILILFLLLIIRKLNKS